MSSTLWSSQSMKKIKKHKEKLLHLYDLVHQNVKGFTGASFQQLPAAAGQDHQPNVKISLGMVQADLKRFADLPSESTFLLNKDSMTVVPLDMIPGEPAGGGLGQTTEPLKGEAQVRFRKGTVNEKDLFIEVWNMKANGFVSSLKVTDKLTKPYRDAVFGGITWSRDGKKIVFVGEVPEIATYKPFFKDAEEKKEEDKDDGEGQIKDKKDEDQKKKEAEKKKKDEEHWQDEKFLYKENFGETLVSKVNGAIFIFDLDENKLQRVNFGKHLDDKTSYVCYPLFDESSTGIVFNCVNMPIKKLGLNFCLNRPTSLIYVKEPKFSKEDADKVEEGKHHQVLNKNEYVGMQPKFSFDFSRLSYIASDKKFLSHAGNY